MLLRDLLGLRRIWILLALTVLVFAEDGIDQIPTASNEVISIKLVVLWCLRSIRAPERDSPLIENFLAIT